MYAVLQEITESERHRLNCLHHILDIKMLDESKKMNLIKKTAAEILGDAETEIIWYTARERLNKNGDLL